MRKSTAKSTQSISITPVPPPNPELIDPGIANAETVDAEAADAKIAEHELPEIEVSDVAPDPNVEPSDVPRLNTQQCKALYALTTGRTVSDAARCAGVYRGTVHRWLRDNADFVAAYNAWQSETHQTARARLMRLTERAVDVVTNALDSQDTKTAVALLKHLAVLSHTYPGSTSPEEIRDEWDAERQKQRKKRQMEKIMVEMGIF